MLRKGPHFGYTCLFIIFHALVHRISLSSISLSPALALKMAVEHIATARSGAETQTFPNVRSPVSQVVGLDVLRPGELAEYDLVLAFDYLLLVDIILPQQTQRIRHCHKISKTAFSLPLPFSSAVRATRVLHRPRSKTHCQHCKPVSGPISPFSVN